MKPRGRILFLVVVVAFLGLSFFCSRHEIYDGEIENTRSISYSYSDYRGKTFTDRITSLDEVNDIKKAIKEVDQSKPKRKLRAEEKTGAMIILFTMLDKEDEEIISYSIKGEYLAVGQQDKKLVTIYSVAHEEMDQLRESFLKAVGR